MQYKKAGKSQKMKFEMAWREDRDGSWLEWRMDINKEMYGDAILVRESLQTIDFNDKIELELLAFRQAMKSYGEICRAIQEG